MLYGDKPAPIHQPGTFRFMDTLDVVYTVGAGHVERAVRDLLCRTNGAVSADIETYGLGLAARRLKVVGFADDHEAVLIDPRDPGQAELIQWVNREATSSTFHNSPYDVPKLYLNGLIRIEDVFKIIDTLILCRLADPGEFVPKNLEEASARYLKTPKLGVLAKAFKSLGLSKQAGYERFDLDRPVYLQGAATDPLLTNRLLPVVRQAAYDKVTKNHPFHRQGLSGQDAWDLVEREQILNRMFLARCCKGYPVDYEYLEKFKVTNGLDMRVMTKELEELGIRPGNGQDLVTWLEKQGAITPDHARTKTGLLSADQKALKNLGHPVAKTFSRLKELTKVQDDYLTKIVDLADKNDRIHPPTNMLKAATGRASMEEPPIHQLPEAARGIILLGDGTSIDWSQIEPITIANAAKDTQVIEAYESGKSDVYTQLGVGSGMLPPGTTPAMCEIGVNHAFYDIRKKLKVSFLAQVYGEGLKKLTADLGLDPGPYYPANDWEIEVLEVEPGTLMPHYAAARKLQAAVFTAMPQTEQYIKKLKNIARQYKKTVTIGGRILDIPMSIFHGRWTVATHKGVNYWNQGSAYDILADALIRIIEAGLGEAIHFTMHDELIIDTEPAHDIRKIMETPSERLCFWAGRVPVLRTDMVHLGERWAAA